MDAGGRACDGWAPPRGERSMIATDPPSLRFFPYRPRLGGQLLAVLFFGLGAVVLAHASSEPHEMAVGGVRLSPGQAAMLYRVLSGLSCALVAAALVNVVRRAVGHRRIVLGVDFISVPDASSPTHERRVPFAEIADVTCTAVIGQRFLQLSLR